MYAFTWTIFQIILSCQITSECRTLGLPFVCVKCESHYTYKICFLLKYFYFQVHYFLQTLFSLKEKSSGIRLAQSTCTSNCLPLLSPTREEKVEEGRCHYERYRQLVQNKFHGVSENEALARIEVEEMYPSKSKDKGKQK